jgi:hypothetical protein
MDAGDPCRHDGDLLFSSSVGERKIMKHFVVKMSVSILVAAKPRCALYTLRFV